MPAADGTPSVERSLREPHESRLPLGHPLRSEILAAHDEALATGMAGYSDPATGFFVFTAATLRDNDVCCECGCRHCPYV